MRATLLIAAAAILAFCAPQRSEADWQWVPVPVGHTDCTAGMWDDPDERESLGALAVDQTEPDPRFCNISAEGKPAICWPENRGRPRLPQPLCMYKNAPYQQCSGGERTRTWVCENR
jgi:hypothetical protein